LTNVLKCAILYTSSIQTTEGFLMFERLSRLNFEQQLVIALILGMFVLLFVIIYLIRVIVEMKQKEHNMVSVNLRLGNRALIAEGNVRDFIQAYSPQQMSQERIRANNARIIGERLYRENELIRDQNKKYPVN